MTTNYRGITLLSNLGKLFASVLDSRIERWYKENGILSDAQLDSAKEGVQLIQYLFYIN